MPETVPLPGASSSKLLWDPVPRHRSCSAHGGWSQPSWGSESWVLLVAMVGGRWCRWGVWCHQAARRVGFGDSNILGVLWCAVRCGGGGMLRQHHHTRLEQEPCAGCWLGQGNNLHFLSGLGCHKIPQERAVTPQNIQVGASVSLSGDHLCPASTSPPTNTLLLQMCYSWEMLPMEKTWVLQLTIPNLGSPSHPNRAGSRGKAVGSPAAVSPHVPACLA